MDFICKPMNYQVLERLNPLSFTYQKVNYWIIAEECNPEMDSLLKYVLTFFLGSDLHYKYYQINMDKSDKIICR